MLKVVLLMKKTLFSNESPVVELGYASESIADFAHAGLSAIGEASQKLLSKISGIAQSFSETKQVGELADIKNLGAPEQQFLSLVESHSFAEIRQLRAHVPEGFNGNYLEYSAELARITSQLVNVGASVLQPYTVFLASLMGTSDLSKLANDNKHITQALDSQRKADEKALSAFFKTGRKDAELTIGEVMHRNADWPAVLINLKKSVDAVNQVDRKQLAQLIAQAKDYLDIIHQRLATGKMNKITAQTAQALADGAYQVASQLEFYSIVHFRTLVFSQAVKDTVVRVNSILG